MSNSTFETGHAKNLSNFDEMLVNIRIIGSDFTPPNTQIQGASLTAGFNASRAAQDDLTKKEQLARGPVKDRENLFRQLKRVVMRSVKYYRSCGTELNKVEAAEGLAARILDTSRVRYLADGNPDPTWRSNSQQSYVMLAENFGRLIEYYKGDTKYNPTSGGIALGDMDAMHADMRTMNTNLAPIVAEVDQARALRNKLMYSESGIITLTKLVKEYCESLDESHAFTAKTIRRIPFTKLKK